MTRPLNGCGSGSGQRDGVDVAGMAPRIGGRGRCRGGGAGHDESESEHSQGDVPVPASPGAYLVVVQPNLARVGPGTLLRWSNHKWQVLLRAVAAAQPDLVAPAAAVAVISSSGRCCPGRKAR